jgi:oligosaccharide reducing-end xylanase
MFDARAKLAVDEPSGDHAQVTRPSNVMPGYYELWAQATGDDGWLELAQAGRSFLQSTAQPMTGLFPLRASFTGIPERGSEAFVAEGYRTQLNITFDQMFTGGDPWYVTEADRLLDFFSGEGLTTYGASYPLDGSRCIDCRHSVALVSVNGVSALIATQAERSAFIQAVWDSTPPGGQVRYYDGLLHLLSLLTLGGRLRVY